MKSNTSWQKASQKYNETMGVRGGYYHQRVIVPGVLRLLDLKPGDSLLDLGCGQGVLARSLPKGVEYCGIDIAENLLLFARKYSSRLSSCFVKGDITQPLSVKKNFTHAAIILTLQNLSQPEMAIKNASLHLNKGGKLAIVINHPCFRIPKETSWQIDKKARVQYRRIDRYSSPLKIPINMEPSRRNRAPITWSFHFPLTDYSRFLNKNGFLIEKIEEWISDKISVGTNSFMENTARKEFPLFMAIVARKS